MKIFDLDGKPVKTLVELNRSVRRRIRAERSSVVPLLPGSYNLVTKGRGLPGGGFAKRCLVCRKFIKAGESWESQDNGQYSTIRHSSCCGKRKSVL